MKKTVKLSRGNGMIIVSLDGATSTLRLTSGGNQAALGSVCTCADDWVWGVDLMEP